MVTLREPDGSPLEVELVEVRGTVAVFDVDGAAWAPLAARGAFHVDRGGDLPRFDAGRPVRVEAELEPMAAFATDVVHRLDRADPEDPVLDLELWWARSLTQAVDLPPDLAEEGELHDGVTLPAPPWGDGSPLLDLVQEVLEGQGMAVVRPDEDATVLQVVLDGFELWVVTHEPLNLVTAYAVLPPTGGEVDALLVEAARRNEQVAVGSYEVDPDTGLVSFKTGIDVEGDRLSVALVRQLLGTAIVGGRRWLDERSP